jgi:hypothetical protein
MVLLPLFDKPSHIVGGEGTDRPTPERRKQVDAHHALVSGKRAWSLVSVRGKPLRRDLVERPSRLARVDPGPLTQV